MITPLVFSTFSYSRNVFIDANLNMGDKDWLRSTFSIVNIPFICSNISAEATTSYRASCLHGFMAGFYDRNHEFVDRYAISAAQMT